MTNPWAFICFIKLNIEPDLAQDNSTCSVFQPNGVLEGLNVGADE